MQYDVVIIGASFAGLSLAHHLPSHLKVLILDMKRELNQSVESTGLITEHTYQLLKSFLPELDRYIPNRITTIGVVAPDYEHYFFSHTKDPWIYSTDTPAILEHLSKNLPSNVTLKIASQFTEYKVEAGEQQRVPTEAEHPVRVLYVNDGTRHEVQARFIVGADGSLSRVAQVNPRLSKNKEFLAGVEKVFYGKIMLGPHPDLTVYHFWFGEFSLGYGGWLSPTEIDGKAAFRLGLAKLKEDSKDIGRIKDFIEVLKEKKMIEIEPGTKEILTFGHLIPIGGPLKTVHDEHSLLLGDAAGLCGAFAADGIKGALVSGMVSAKLISEHLKGDRAALGRFHSEIQKYGRLMRYYRKQVLYRFIWERMKSNRSFFALWKVIEREKESFLYQFCDSKDRNKSLISVVLKWRNFPLLMKYALSLVRDLFNKWPI
ncbi:NAD(P)/FAD-dependent oxidoreductase [Candidatus Peregrinibacteria bacterium]|nr:MAG: NAD(P)/FAD-dependent oxidoreductase [Candidatus Peregrinibacteria bacterium]